MKHIQFNNTEYYALNRACSALESMAIDMQDFISVSGVIANESESEDGSDKSKVQKLKSLALRLLEWIKSVGRGIVERLKKVGAFVKEKLMAAFAPVVAKLKSGGKAIAEAVSTNKADEAAAELNKKFDAGQKAVYMSFSMTSDINFSAITNSVENNNQIIENVCKLISTITVRNVSSHAEIGEKIKAEIGKADKSKELVAELFATTDDETKLVGKNVVGFNFSQFIIMAMDLRANYEGKVGEFNRNAEIFFTRVSDTTKALLAVDAKDPNHEAVGNTLSMLNEVVAAFNDADIANTVNETNRAVASFVKMAHALL